MAVKRAEGDAPAFWRASEADEWQEATIYVPPLPHLRPDYQTPQTWPPGAGEIKMLAAQPTPSDDVTP